MASTSRQVRLGVAVIASLLWAATPLAARAETGEVTALRQEVNELKQVVQRLDERLERLEARLSAQSKASSSEARVASPEASGASPEASAASPQATAASAPAPEPAAPATAVSSGSARDHWHRIDHGMTPQEVEALLGRPQRTMTVNAKTVWYYAYPDIGAGSVVFAPDDGVADWQTPPFNTWW
jgi:TolA-binding protein